ncbi:MAG: T9SS type A sorting domain-containing protein [Bacteroidales bacterium]|nr:T9SS type A sorting domain-containing protein [Bacteroidales bacterium]
MGQVVKRFEVNANNAVCDVEDLTSGVYVVRIYGNPRTSTSSLRQAQCATVSGIIRKFVKE